MTPTKSFANAVVLASITIVLILTGNTATAQQSVAVKVANAPSVKSQDDGVRQPLPLGAGIDFVDGSSTPVGFPLLDFFTVPAGKQLVLDFWSAGINVPLGQRALAKLSGCAAHDIFLPLGAPANFGSATVDTLVNGGALKAYCNPGDRLVLQIDKSSSSGPASAGQINFVGHLVNLP